MVLRVGIVGVGRWGTNHARVLAELQEEGLIEFSAVCDVNEAHARQVAKRFRVPLATTNLESFSKSVDAAIIATSIDSLYPVSRKLLEQGIDLLIEKPVATTPQEVRELRRIAERMNLVAIPGFIMRFNPVVERIRELVKSEGALYTVFRRLSRRAPENRRYPLILDLAVHDIDLCFYIHGIDEWTIESSTIIRSHIDDIVIAVLRLGDKRCVVHVDGLSLTKVREIEVIAENVFVRGNTDDMIVEIRRADGSYVIEKLSSEEPLLREDRAFVEKVYGKSVDVPDLDEAIRVLEVVETIMRKR